MERASNAYSIVLLEALSPLEQLRFDTSNQLMVGNQTGAILRGIDACLKHHKEYLERMLKKAGNDAVKIQRVQTLIDQLEDKKQELVDLLKPNTLVQTVYRKVLEQFETTQRQISNYQFSSQNPLSRANQSLTEAYQNASNAMESHIFSREKPSDKQLWKGLPKDAQLDTSTCPLKRPADALFTACLLKKDQSPNINPLTVYDTEKKKIARVNVKNKESLRYKALQLLDKDKRTKKEKQELGNDGRDSKHSVDPISAATKRSTDNTNFLKAEAVQVYNPSDLISAVGGAVLDICKYFEQEMAGKHPAMTAGFFVLLGATFGTAGLAAAGRHTASMNHLLNAVTKALTANGKVGVSPEKVASAAKSIVAEWNAITFTGHSAMHVAIMDLIGLPKIATVGADTLLNGIDDDDNLTQLCQRLCPESLEGKTDPEEVAEMKRKVVQTACILALATGACLLIDVISTLPVVGHMAGAAQAVVGSGDLPAFQALAGSASVAQAAFNVTALLLTIKSSAILVGKVGLVLYHMQGAQKYPEQAKALQSMLLLQELGRGSQLANLEVQDPHDPDKKIKTTHQQATNITENFKKLVERDPKVLQLFNPDVLIDQGLTFSRSALGTAGLLPESFVTRVSRTIRGIPQAIWNMLKQVEHLPAWLKSINPRKAFIKGLLAGARIFTGLLIASTKTVVLSLYGLTQRLAMGIAEFPFMNALSVYRGFKNLFAGERKAALASILAIPAKAVLFAAELLTKVIFAIPLVPLWIAKQFTPKKGTSLDDTMPPSSTALEKVRGLRQIIIDNIRSASAYFSRALTNNDGNDPTVTGLVTSRDKTVNDIAKGFDFLKNQIGNVLYYFRNKTIRNLERNLQADPQIPESNVPTLPQTCQSTSPAEKARTAQDPPKAHDTPGNIQPKTSTVTGAEQYKSQLRINGATNDGDDEDSSSDHPHA